jgi:hypothetical protein
MADSNTGVLRGVPIAKTKVMENPQNDKGIVF